MRVAILSDIHGNAHALRCCLDDLAERGGADVVVAAGDLCIDGPKPKRVLELLSRVGAQALRGNTDRMVGAEPLHALDPDDAEAVQWTQRQIGPDWTRWLGALPPTIALGDGADGLLVCHANPKNDDEHVWPDAADDQLERLFDGVVQTTVAFGHLHLPYLRVWRGRTLVNVASAGLPKDGDSRAHYVLLTQRPRGWEVQSRRVAFNVDKVARQLEESGIPHLAKRLNTLRRHRYPMLGEPGSLIP